MRPPTHPRTSPCHPQTHHILPQYSSSIQQLMCTQFIRRAPWSSRESTMGSENKATKRQQHIPTNALTHPHTHRPYHPPTHQTYPPTMCYSNTAVRTAGHALVHAEVIPCVVQGFPFLKIPRHPRERSGQSPGGRLFKAPARQVGFRRPFFRRGNRGLMSGAGMARSWCRGRPGGARESQLFFGYIVTKIVKDSFGRHRHHHHPHYRAALHIKDRRRETKSSTLRGSLSFSPLLFFATFAVFGDCPSKVYAVVAGSEPTQHRIHVSSKSLTGSARRMRLTVEHGQRRVCAHCRVSQQRSLHSTILREDLTTSRYQVMFTAWPV